MSDEMDAMDKLELGKTLDKYRVTKVEYNPTTDTYAVTFIDKYDKEVVDTIVGDELG